MGDIDINVKNFVKINSVFAQLFSQGVYGGKIRIAPDKLEEMDALSYSYQCRKISEKAKERMELKRYADGVPKGTKLLPVVTLVFYVGKDPWDGPLSLYDMLDIPEGMKEQIKYTMPDYRMNLIDARHMSDEEIDRFEGDLKAFLLLLRERFDREKLKSVVAMHRETWYAISKIKKDNRYTKYIDNVSDEKLTGGLDMDMALDNFIEENMEKINRLNLLLIEDKRVEDIVKSAKDRKYQKQLLQKYGLEDK